jgi:hypothetical protein
MSVVSPLAPPTALLSALLATLSWVGFIAAGFVLWAEGNTNGGYSMVGIAICLPAVVAVALPFVGSCGKKTPSAAVPPTASASAVVVDAGVTV